MAAAPPPQSKERRVTVTEGVAAAEPPVGAAQSERPPRKALPERQASASSSWSFISKRNGGGRAVTAPAGVTEMVAVAGGALMQALRWKEYALAKRVKSGRDVYEACDLTKALYSVDSCTLTQNLVNLEEIIIQDEHKRTGQAELNKIRRGQRGGEAEAFSFLVTWWVKLADFGLIVFVLYSVFTAPLTFMWGGSWAEPDLVPFGRSLLVLDLIADIVYGGYCILRLHVSFMHPVRCTEIMDKEEIRFALFHSVLYWLMVFSATSHLWFGCFGVTLLLNNIKMVRLSHIMKPPDSLWRYSDRLWARLFKPLVLLVGCAHWVACLLTYCGGYREAFADDCGRYETNFGEWRISCGVSLYFMAFVEALYMLTGSLDNPLGDGGPREGNFGALLIVSFFGPIGCVIVALIISGIVREQTMLQALDTRHQESKAFMKRAMNILDIPETLQRRVVSMHYYQKMAHDAEAFDQLFHKKHLSPVLKNALLVYNYKPLVDKSQYLQGKDKNYIIELLRILKDNSFLPGDYIARKGEISDTMMFINRGTVGVFVANDAAGENKDRISRAQPIRTLQQGTHFGEIALIQDTVRSAWIKAECYVLVASLSRKDIQPVWKHYPEEEQHLRELVLDLKRQDRTRKRRTLKVPAGGELPVTFSSSEGEAPTSGRRGTVNGTGTSGTAQETKLDTRTEVAGSQIVDVLRSLEERVGELARRQAAVEELLRQQRSPADPAGRGPAAGQGQEPRRARGGGHRDTRNTEATASTAAAGENRRVRTRQARSQTTRLAGTLTGEGHTAPAARAAPGAGAAPRQDSRASWLMGGSSDGSFIAEDPEEQQGEEAQDDAVGSV